MTKVVGNQQVGIRPGVGTNGVAGPKVKVPDYAKRSDYLEADTVDISSKKDRDSEKSIAKTIGNGVKSFVNITVNAFAKAASEIVVDKAIGKMAGK